MIKPASPVLVGEFFTSAPPGKSFSCIKVFSKIKILYICDVPCDVSIKLQRTQDRVQMKINESLNNESNNHTKEGGENDL